jgi:NitT/TauT family transport system substrate-binding protein
VSRRRWLLLATAATGALAAACSSAPAAAPTTAPKPTEAAKPTTAPAASPAAGASPAAAASPAAGASPAASPATAASPAASPAAQAAPASGGTVATAKPSSMKPASQVMNWFAQSSQGGFFTGMKFGHYEKQNIKMEMQQGGPGISTIPLVASEKVTFGMTAGENLLLAREEGIPVVMVFGTFQTNPQGLMYHLSNPVKDFPDLNGRKVYVNAAGTFWQVLAAKYKLDKVQQLNYNGQLPVFLSDETNVSQCFISSEPVILKAQGKEVGYLLNADSGFNPYQNAMVVFEKTLKEQPELVQAYVTASLQAWVEFVKDPKPTLDYIKSDFNKEKDVDTELKVFEVEKNQLLTGKSGFDPKQMGLLTDARFKDLYTMMREYNVLKKDVDYKLAFDSSFIEKAHAALGI